LSSVGLLSTTKLSQHSSAEIRTCLHAVNWASSYSSNNTPAPVWFVPIASTRYC